VLEAPRIGEEGGAGAAIKEDRVEQIKRTPFERASDATIAAFAAVLMKAGYIAPVRTPRGRDILAACGQLKSASERSRKSRSSALPVA